MTVEALPSSRSWSDPHPVPEEQLRAFIARLERECAEHPSCDLHTCRGVAHALNADACRSIEALELARAMDPRSFWAQFEYAQLHYRLRAFARADAEMRKALTLARTADERDIAEGQLRNRGRKVKVRARSCAPIRVTVLRATLLLIAVLMLVAAARC